jgi:vacuolar-type H+-ATPase subunit I/STV1
MAISKMAKVMIVSHRSEADDVLTRLQQAGIIQILNAEHAIISKDMPELCCAGQRPRELEEITIRLNSAVGFLKQYGQLPKGMVSMLSPKPVVEEDFYQKIACDEKLLEITKNAE